MPKKKWDDDAVRALFELKDCQFTGTYGAYRDKLAFRCHCSRDSEVLLEVLLRPKWGGCGGCRCERAGKARSRNANSHEKIRDFFAAKGCVLLTNYKNSRQELEYTCGSCEKIAKITYNRAIKKSWEGCCEPCSYKKRASKKSKKNVAQEFAAKEMILTSEYTNSKCTLEYTCRCKKEGCKITYASFSKPDFVGCDDCTRTRMEENSMKKYGVRNPIQNPDIAEKCMTNAHRYKEYAFPCGKVSKYQGYENFCLDHLLKMGFEGEDILVGREMGIQIPYLLPGETKQRIYNPDIFIPSEGLIIEVKSEWTLTEEKREMVKAKLLATVARNYHVYLMVFDKKGRVIKKFSFIPW